MFAVVLKYKKPLEEAEDPFSIEGIADYEIYEFTPGKYQPVLKELIEA
jgi:hypothetical protein